jgi:hypothetical protein
VITSYSIQKLSISVSWEFKIPKPSKTEVLETFKIENFENNHARRGRRGIS